MRGTPCEWDVLRIESSRRDRDLDETDRGPEEEE